ncbi:DNA-binding protein [Pseudomonas bohemica]|uniref:DNA-binding protein n=1 Tax=Pseudomonas bohemica TaxID=2044872 RepID=UPI000DA6059D|nr:DNA-binding protein [Pseudomonas bohemica]
MAVGVPENDVFAAADAVLARGERPTVERVRLELGRGSPARVGGLLDQWWEQLAGRLRGETRLPGLPAEVAQAFVAIWQQATVLAQGLVEQSLAGQRQILEEERAHAAGIEDAARQDVAQYRHQAAAALTEQQGAERRMADLERLLNQGQRQIEDLALQRDGLKDERDAGRARIQELERQLLTNRYEAEQARSAHEMYVRGVEERAHREVDRAREENKATQLLVKQLGKQADQLRERRELAAAQLGEAREQNAGLQALAEQQERQVHSAQDALKRVQDELSQAMKGLTAQQARAETLEQMIAQLRLPAKPTRKKAPTKPRRPNPN